MPQPLRPSLAGSIEFGKLRKKITLGDRLKEIAKLREDLLAERQALELEEMQEGLAKERSHRHKGKQRGVSSLEREDLGHL